MKPTLYPNGFPSVYEEIKTFFPLFYRNVFEIDAIWRTCGVNLGKIEDDVNRIVGSTYILMMDEEVLAQFESFLYIRYEGQRTLAERRALVASFFIGNGHIGAPEIKELMRGFTNGDVSVALIGGSVEVSVTREISDRFNLTDSAFVLRKRIPAHLDVAFNDILMPIRFVNKTGLSFTQFHFGIGVFNGAGPPPIFLDGQRVFDGTWAFAQRLRGIGMPRVALRASFTRHKTALSTALALSPMRIANPVCNRFATFSAHAGGRNRGAISYMATGYMLSVRQPQGFAGTITMDSMYRLDGTALLDGSRKLNAEIIKEDI